MTRSRWDAVVASAAIVAAAVAVWVTLRADFLAHPGWLAVQKADMILGPVLTGLYWRRRRPGSRFATLLIVVGFLHVPYILQSSSAPLAFSVGVIWEGVVYVVTLALILAFPTGRLDGPVRNHHRSGPRIGGRGGGAGRLTDHASGATRRRC